MNNLFAYLHYRRLLLCYYLLTGATLLLVHFLSGQDMRYAWYVLLLITVFLGILLCIDGRRYVKQRKALRQLQAQLDAADSRLPRPTHALEADYLSIIATLRQQYSALKSDTLNTYKDTLDYYTLWVHQIKTPIAAMRLVLQDMPEAQTKVLLQELFKVEQYADTALRYVKLSHLSSDLILEHCDLNQLVRQCVKKYSLLFVYQKLTVEIQPLPKDVVSDKKWLAFLLEQLLSNAIKYTKKGGIRIFEEKGALVIQDSGIGIKSEDLPRIFEKGYTGYNGRLDNRASGIGLYLVRRTAKALAIHVDITSTLGEGTKVRLFFPSHDAFPYL